MECLPIVLVVIRGKIISIWAETISTIAAMNAILVVGTLML